MDCHFLVSPNCGASSDKFDFSIANFTYDNIVQYESQGYPVEDQAKFNLLLKYYSSFQNGEYLPESGMLDQFVWELKGKDLNYYINNDFLILYKRT